MYSVFQSAKHFYFSREDVGLIILGTSLWVLFFPLHFWTGCHPEDKANKCLWSCVELCCSDRITLWYPHRCPAANGAWAPISGLVQPTTGVPVHNQPWGMQTQKSSHPSAPSWCPLVPHGGGRKGLVITWLSRNFKLEWIPHQVTFLRKTWASKNNIHINLSAFLLLS